VARIIAELKRGALRTLYRQRGDGVALSDALNAFQDTNWLSVSSGRVITAHTSTGKTTQFALPQIWQSFSQEEWFALTEELQQVYSDCKTNLINAGNPTPTDDQIFAAMMQDDRLQTITSVQKDFGTMRWPTRL